MVVGVEGGEVTLLAQYDHEARAARLAELLEAEEARHAAVLQARAERAEARQALAARLRCHAATPAAFAFARIALFGFGTVGSALGMGHGAGGETYEGEWLNDMMHGRGTFEYASGAKYVGQFKDGKMHTGLVVVQWQLADQGPETGGLALSGGRLEAVAACTIM